MPNSKHSHANDDENARIVRLSGEDVEAAERLLRAMSGEPNRLKPSVAVPVIGQRKLTELATEILEQRRRRLRFFNPAMFGEPAWDILLLLYVNSAAGIRQTTVKISESLDTPLSSVIRWLGYLEKERMIEREAHPTDRRIMFLHPSEKALGQLEAYLSAMASSE